MGLVRQSLLSQVPSMGITIQIRRLGVDVSLSGLDIFSESSDSNVIGPGYFVCDGPMGTVMSFCSYTYRSTNSSFHKCTNVDCRITNLGSAYMRLGRGVT